MVDASNGTTLSVNRTEAVVVFRRNSHAHILIVGEPLSILTCAPQPHHFC